jgi:hypothetical protein
MPSILRVPHMTAPLLAETAPEGEPGIWSEWLPGAALVLVIVAVLVWLKWYHWPRK